MSQTTGGTRENNWRMAQTFRNSFRECRPCINVKDRAECSAPLFKRPAAGSVLCAELGQPDPVNYKDDFTTGAARKANIKLIS